ncbi:hypothetical protein LTR09_002899 [Extremus antarcticus]|uniref:HbrB-like protein n=1 Tax=Extremus antarcticus TaxID=702011 RepID=A0AAJ0LV76_9PEZI|nr:hypothetical protein LTR09_002899 [Extremus antarcticus]
MEAPPLRYPQQVPARPSTASGPAPSHNAYTLQTGPRQQVRTSVDGGYRAASPATPQQQIGHRARQHSQGFFEPSLPHASANASGLTASQIAAQAAMHHISPPPNGPNERKRSYPGLSPINTTQPSFAQRQPSNTQSPQVNSASALSYSNGTVGGNKLAATSAANAAFPNGRSPLPSPGLLASQAMPPPPLPSEPKAKSSKMKLFSKPKSIGLSKEKESKVQPALPSPGKLSLNPLSRTGFANMSTTSLLDQGSSASSIYSSANASTSTLVPANSEKEKRHHFLSRQKNKPKDEAAPLPLSSAHSNSQATNPDKPQPLYSFTPDSPGTSSFAKSVSNFDIRQGARALRERKAEKAAAKMELAPVISNTSVGGVSDQFGPAIYATDITGPPSATPAGSFAFPNDTLPPISAQQFSNIGASMGIHGMGPDDAWPLIKARLLYLFSGEEVRTPIEDFNTLVGVHIKRCVQKQSPVVVVEDLRELLETGFGSLAQTLRGVADDRLVTKLVEMWIGVYGSILPFLQAVFLPMDLEFRGRGIIMSVTEAQEFWGAMPESLKSDERPSSSGGTMRMPSLGEELDVKRITLIAFRDAVILPRHESLMAIFSRLSLDSINASTSPDPNAAGSSGRQHARSDPATTGAERPGTAGSLSPHMSSFNSQGSTLLDAGSSSSGGTMSAASRSRATSNTSAGSFGTSMPHLASPLGGPGSFSATTQPPHSPLPPADPTKVTETVARMLQCLYVLASCQTGDVGQGVVERLTGALKYNWLGRGRTGRDRRGFVGVKRPVGQRVGLVGA